MVAARGAARIAGERGHLVHISTSFLGNWTVGQPLDRANFRNAYEWSKAGSESAVVEEARHWSVARIPQIIGSRVDGGILRYDGLYSLFGTLSAGLLPVLVGDAHASVDVAPCNDAADLIDSMIAARTHGRVEVLSTGDNALEVEAMLEILHSSLNNHRLAAGAELLPEIPIVSHELWDRLYWPLAEEILTSTEKRAIRLAMEFANYTDVFHGGEPTRVVEDPAGLLRICLDRWALDNRRRFRRPLKRWEPRASSEAKN